VKTRICHSVLFLSAVVPHPMQGLVGVFMTHLRKQRSKNSISKNLVGPPSLKFRFSTLNIPTVLVVANPSKFCGSCISIHCIYPHVLKLFSVQEISFHKYLIIFSCKHSKPHWPNPNCVMGCFTSFGVHQFSPVNIIFQSPTTSPVPG